MRLRRGARASLPRHRRPAGPPCGFAPEKRSEKIRSVGSFTAGSNLSLVRVRADYGAEGFGQIAPHEDDAWTRNLFEPALEVREGKVDVPGGPGRGVRINPRWMAEARREVTQQS